MPSARPLVLSALVLAAGLAGCSDPSEPELVGPDYGPGAGRLYPVRTVQFATADGVTVSGLLGAASGARGLPAVILLHDLDGTKETWISESALFEELLEHRYAVLAIDLRGFGQTALPGGRQAPEMTDLEASFGDVQGALSFLAGRPEVDTLRVAVVGAGTGGNVAYVSKGVLGPRLRTAVCVSAGLWDRVTLQPAVVGAGLSPFAPASILFLVGGDDAIAVDGTGEAVLSYADFASGLAATTADPRSVAVLPGSDAHGLALLSSEPAALGMIMAWLEQRL